MLHRVKSAGDSATRRSPLLHEPDWSERTLPANAPALKKIRNTEKYVGWQIVRDNSKPSCCTTWRQEAEQPNSRCWTENWIKKPYAPRVNLMRTDLLTCSPVPKEIHNAGTSEDWRTVRNISSEPCSSTWRQQEIHWRKGGRQYESTKLNKFRLHESSAHNLRQKSDL